MENISLSNMILNYQQSHFSIGSPRDLSLHACANTEFSLHKITNAHVINFSYQCFEILGN